MWILITSPLTVFLRYGQLDFSKVTEIISNRLTSTTTNPDLFVFPKYFQIPWELMDFLTLSLLHSFLKLFWNYFLKQQDEEARRAPRLLVDHNHRHHLLQNCRQSAADMLRLNFILQLDIRSFVPIIKKLFCPFQLFHQWWYQHPPWK